MGDWGGKAKDLLTIANFFWQRPPASHYNSYFNFLIPIAKISKYEQSKA